MGLGHKGRAQKRQGILADAEKPVGVTSPLYIGRFSHVPLAGQVGALIQLIKNDAVVQAADRHEHAFVVGIKQFIALSRDFAQAHHGRAKVVAGAPKVNAGVLFFWFHFEEHHRFGVFIGHNNVPHEADVAFVVQSAKKMVKAFRYVKMLAKRLRQHVLVKIQGRESL